MIIILTATGSSPSGYAEDMTASAKPDGALHGRAEMLLAARGQKYTTGRRAIVSALAATGHPATIAELQGAAPGLPASTAYRNMTVLSEAGIVIRIGGTDEFARFELSEELSGQHHHHIVCTDCGLVLDTSSSPGLEDALAEAVRGVVQAGGFEITGHRLELVGRCTSCQ
jgi:Fur family transcriptional regulator, ferric uptake regulator